MPVSAKDWLEGRKAAQAEAVRLGARSGPRYGGNNNTFTPWHDQYFAKEITPAGTVSCPQALRVGAVLQSLQVTLVASHANQKDLELAAGATITLNLLEGTEENGTFTDVGPTTCIRVPVGGKVVAPDDVIYSFPLTDFQKPWLMVSLEFDGAIAGGTVDVALTYVPR